MIRLPSNYANFARQKADALMQDFLRLARGEISVAELQPKNSLFGKDSPLGEAAEWEINWSEYSEKISFARTSYV